MANLTIELQEQQQKAIAGLPYLSMQLDRDVTVTVPLKFIRETLVLASDRFTQMPNVHPCLMGLIEHRSNIFWVLDLPQLLGFSPIDSTAIDIHMAILQTTNMFLGLAVYRIGNVKRIMDTDIRSPVIQDLPKAIMPFLQGSLENETEKIYVLNTEMLTKLNLNFNSRT